jgi:hypothetical protein
MIILIGNITKFPDFGQRVSNYNLILFSVGPWTAFLPQPLPSIAFAGLVFIFGLMMSTFWTMFDLAIKAESTSKDNKAEALGAIKVLTVASWSCCGYPNNLKQDLNMF